MPRSSSSSSRSSSSYSRPSYSTSSRPHHSATSRSSYSSPSKPITNTPSVAPTQTQPSTVHHKVEQPGFFSNVMQGFAWGTGTSIARNIFESKPTVVAAPPVTTPSITPSTTYTSTPINDCREYDLCKKLDDPYECFSKLDQNLYNKCHKD